MLSVGIELPTLRLLLPTLTDRGTPPITPCNKGLQRLSNGLMFKMSFHNSSALLYQIDAKFLEK